MACVENIPPINGDSEMEEGEIVDDLSDISSEEEFLLRQRLQVLENYNNVLERKKAKRYSIDPGTKSRKQDALLHELSEISATELDDYSPHRNKVQRHVKTHKQKRRRDEPIEKQEPKTKDKKKSYRTKRKLEVKIISESSEESEDEYRNRRRKLADAVLVNNISRNDKTSLSERLQKMLCGVNPEPTKLILPETKTNTQIEDIKNIPKSVQLNDNFKEIETLPEETSQELIDLCTDEDNKVAAMQLEDSVDTVDSVIKTIEMQDVETNSNITEEIKIDKDSDEDIELLRQHALKTKPSKEKSVDLLTLSENKSEDEDSDTAELRLICLKSALLKKAIEMKQKQKLRKRLSQSSNLNDDLLQEAELFSNAVQSENNTDIESVDMDMGSDIEDKDKEYNNKVIEEVPETVQETVLVQHQDELEEDEDLLRAKLLTSLSKNLPNLVDPKVVETVAVKDTGQVKVAKTVEKVVIPEEKRFIINLGESDSEGEHEATKNLTKMHIKLSEQVDFQQKLDMFLKSTRMEVEKTTLPDVVQQQAQKPEKFVAKAVKHLPRSEQIEYKNLVKRMAELEKMKQARQLNLNMNKALVQMKETLKPRNVESKNLTTNNNLEQQIQNSRKNIAAESAKMLQLKEEGTKLSQKFKIVATELRNIRTAIALNKKQQRSVQTCLTNIRNHHQMLLKSSMASSHSKINQMPLNRMKLQKENNPAKEEKTQPKVIPVKDVKEKVVPKDKIVPKDKVIPKEKVTKEVKEPLVIHHPRLSIQVDVANNKKVVKMSEMSNTGSIENNDKKVSQSHSNPEAKGGGNDIGQKMPSDDYRSPLDAFGSTTWEGDPNAILCPFEVGGDCKDADCKYLHTHKSK